MTARAMRADCSVLNTSADCYVTRAVTQHSGLSWQAIKGQAVRYSVRPGDKVCIVGGERTTLTPIPVPPPPPLSSLPAGSFGFAVHKKGRAAVILSSFRASGVWLALWTELRSQIGALAVLCMLAVCVVI